MLLKPDLFRSGFYVSGYDQNAFMRQQRTFAVIFSQKISDYSYISGRPKYIPESILAIKSFRVN